MIGRNDPCPCGSGKKYKKCCLRLDRQAGAAAELLAGQVRTIAAAAEEWEADVFAMPAGLEDPAGRLAAVLVVAEGFVVHTEVLDRPSPEPEGMAEVLIAALIEADRQLGALPDRVKVRDEATAAALRSALSRLPGDHPLATRVPGVIAAPLPGLDQAAYALVTEMTGQSGRYLASSPDTWAGWSLPEELVARLFRLAAAYHRAEPWAGLDDAALVEAVVPGGGRWGVSVLGSAGEQRGLALYSEAVDFWGMFDKHRHGSPFDDLAGRVLSLTFDRGADLTRAMRREVAAAGWEVAGADAYPRIYALNTPAGGIRRRDAEDLLALLDVVPRFVRANRTAFAERCAVAVWRDAETGAELSWTPAVRYGEGDGDRSVPPLTPGRAEGPGAEPEAALDGAWTVMGSSAAFLDRELELVERFTRHLLEHENLSPATVSKHASRARSLVEYLAASGVPLRAIHEHDLRDYLYRWYPRKSGDGLTRMRSAPGSFRRFFEYLAAEEGIVCRWAFDLLAERERLLDVWETAPGGPFWDPEVQDWRAEQGEELVDLAMVPDQGLGGDDETWGAMMGITENRLYNELARRWLLWRDELLDAGVTDWQELVDRLIERQREWERAPHPRCGGRSPVEAVLAERERREGRTRP